jgi:glutamate dehydrogenase/leucine dehydrogenase
MANEHHLEADAYRMAQWQFGQAAERLGLDEGMREILRSVNRELTVNFPVFMDDGSIRVFTGYRVQHNLARGPAKGGIRYHPQVTLSEIRALSMWMTWKCAVVNIPLSIGGSVGRTDATGRGCVYVIAEAAQRLGLQLDGATVSIQGFGNAGSAAAKILAEHGCKIVAVSDSQGGVRNPRGLDVVGLLQHKYATGTVMGFPDSEAVMREEVLELPCDILVPAALEGQITAGNAPRLRAKIVAEAANGPTTPKADKILDERGILIL